MGKKKKKSKKKPSLSNLEREKFRLQIEDRQNKIEWRKEMCEVIKEDIQLCQEAYHLQQQDKVSAIRLLEEALKNQTLRNEQIRAAVPDAEKKKTEVEKTKARELARSLLEIDEEKSKGINELKTLQKKLTVIESYNVGNESQKISELEKKLTNGNDKKNRKIILRERQEDALRAEMLEIFKEKAAVYQKNCSGKLDKNIERIAEETRWLKDSGDILSSMKDSLEQKNAAIKTRIKQEKKGLKDRKDKALQMSIAVEEQKREIAKVEKRNIKLKEREEREAELLKEEKLLVALRETSKQDLEELNGKLQEYTSTLRYNENKIQNLENQVLRENQLACDLRNVIQEAKSIIAEDLKYPVIKMNIGTPQQMSILNKLESLFDEATKRILESQNQ